LLDSAFEMSISRDGTALQDCGTKDTPQIQEKARTAPLSRCAVLSV
jgi:hypothetical protein